MPRGRGGARQPSNPAPVPAAGPGAGAGQNRTDGGPGNSKQPLRRLPDADYGANKAFVEQQQAAPLPMSEAMNVQPNIFAPSERPNEPATAGTPIGDGPGPNMIQDNTDVILEAIYQLNPSPVLLEIINNRKG